MYKELNIKYKFSRWFKTVLDYGFEEDEDFKQGHVCTLLRNANGEYKKELIDYNMTVDMAKEICMISKTPKGKQVRKYFIKLEQAYRDAQFRIGDKKHQLECMELLCDMLSEEEKQNKVNYIKANTVVNKAVSNYFGFPKMLKKAEMNPDMLYLRENVLDDYVKLFDVLNDNGKVKEIIYNKYAKNLLESKGE